MKHWNISQLRSHSSALLQPGKVFSPLIALLLRTGWLYSICSVGSAAQTLYRQRAHVSTKRKFGFYFIFCTLRNFIDRAVWCSGNVLDLYYRGALVEHSEKRFEQISAIPPGKWRDSKSLRPPKQLPSKCFTYHPSSHFLALYNLTRRSCRHYTLVNNCI